MQTSCVHVYRFQVTGLGWLLFCSPPGEEATCFGLWDWQLLDFTYASLRLNTFISALAICTFLCLLHPFSYPVFLTWECVVLRLESGVLSTLSPCSARLHFSSKSSDVQVLFYGGPKAFNGSTAFLIYLGCCFYYEDLLICCACAHGGQRTARKSQISSSSSRKLNSSPWAWLQVPLPAEPSHQHKTFNFNVPPNRFCFMLVLGFPGS